MLDRVRAIRPHANPKGWGVGAPGITPRRRDVADVRLVIGADSRKRHHGHRLVLRDAALRPTPLVVRGQYPVIIGRRIDRKLMPFVAGRFFLLTSCVLAACANPINDQTWSKYIAGGHAQYARGNLTAAEEAYRRAVINAQVGRLGAEKEAYAVHNLALVKRDLCKLDEADDLFQRALELRSNNRDTSPNNLSGTMFELAQLRYERGQYEASASLMERGFPIAEGLGVEQKSPVLYGRVLEEYADSLRRTGRKDDADAAQARARPLLAAPGRDQERSSTVPPFNHPPCR